MPIILNNIPEKQGDLRVDYNQNFVYIISAVVALGGILFGFDLVIISGTVPFFTEDRKSVV